MSSFLKEYSRQAKLYIDLPSQGHYYNDKEVLKDNQYSSVPVFGMNAMDEITFKTPDALLSGTATTEVMQSCIPHIQDPWNIVGLENAIPFKRTLLPSRLYTNQISFTSYRRD